MWTIVAALLVWSSAVPCSVMIGRYHLCVFSVPLRRRTRPLSTTPQSLNWSCRWNRKGEEVELTAVFLECRIVFSVQLKLIVCVSVSFQPEWVWRLNRSQSVLSCWRTTATCCWGKLLSARSSTQRRSSSNSKKWWVSVLFDLLICLLLLFCSHSDSFFYLFSLQLLVLKYVQNKDVFMRYHKAHLTRRLILDISADSEIEENMVEWLRVSYTDS